MMRVLNRDDYEKLARPVVAEFVENKIPLADSLVKTAVAEGLNPDQIKALVQVANTLTHLDLFDRKSDGDKVIEFSPADPKEVLNKVYNGARPEDVQPEEKPSALDFFGCFPDMMEPCGTPPEAQKDEPSPTQNAQVTIIKIRKVAEELNHRKIAAALEYEEGVDRLAAQFASLYGPNFEEFEKDAIDIRGSDAVPILSDIRNLLRLPKIKLAVFEKSARLVDTETPEMKRFMKLASLVEEAKTCEAGLVLLQHRYGSDL